MGIMVQHVKQQCVLEGGIGIKRSAIKTPNYKIDLRKSTTYGGGLKSVRSQFEMKHFECKQFL